MTDAAGDLAALRDHLVAERGLPPDAAQFVTGSTFDEVEASASALAQMISSGTHDTQEQQPAPSMSDLLGDVRAVQMARKGALAALVAGRAQEQPQARDEQGRFASGGFDGGARADGDMPQEPESHDSWLSRVLGSRTADVGARGF